MKGSYAFAFYCFVDEVDMLHQHRYEDYSYLMRKDSAAQMRKQRRRLQTRMTSRKPDFEQLQSELERLTEVLSGLE